MPVLPSPCGGQERHQDGGHPGEAGPAGEEHGRHPESQRQRECGRGIQAAILDGGGGRPGKVARVFCLFLNPSENLKAATCVYCVSAAFLASFCILAFCFAVD